MCVNSGEKLGFSPLCARVSEIRGGKGDLTCCAQLFPMGFFLVGRGLPNFAAGAHNLNWIYLQHVHIQRMMIAYMLVMSSVKHWDSWCVAAPAINGSFLGVVKALDRCLPHPLAMRLDAHI